MLSHYFMCRPLNPFLALVMPWMSVSLGHTICTYYPRLGPALAPVGQGIGNRDLPILANTGSIYRELILCCFSYQIQNQLSNQVKQHHLLALKITGPNSYAASCNNRHHNSVCD